MGKTLWKGLIRLGGLDVPVKLHMAVKEERIQFHLLHRRDHVRLKQQMVCMYEKVPVPPEEEIRGFELKDGEYVLVDPEELEQTGKAESRTIQIREFVRAGAIDPIFFDRVYYLEPEPPSKRYLTLASVLTEMGVQGICTFAMRKRAYVAALQAGGIMLRLHILRYADEVIPVSSLELPDVTLSEKELKIGIDLINHLAGPFQPEKFVNEHEKKLQDLIDKKARGEKIAILRPKRVRPTPSDKLLETLEASLKRVA
ncbi:MAG TPA: Ku protein [Syntrophorhabdaceae bacterium]|nr:Ku protein [Syntrophorhabdaceae bacterium]